MSCTACGHENRPGRKFCGGCGAALARVCAACGTPAEAGESFCGECGTPTTAGAAPPRSDPDPGSRVAARSPGPPAPATSTGDLLRPRTSREGERKQVTVLFADVKGSMELAEQLDPEEWTKIMQRFFAILSDGVARFEGYVDKFTGDGIMALFGAPIAHEDHAQRACWTALALRDAVAHYATEVKRAHGIAFSMRLGLHTGEVVVGDVGSGADRRPTYTAQGHTVGLAQRMEALASPDTCYLSAATAAQVAGYFALEDLGEFRVKGHSEPLRVHRLVGPGRVRTRFEASRARGLSSFVGRDADVRVLDEALAAAQSGEARVIGIVAEAGTGKSRLCHEVAERWRARGITVNFGRALAHGKHIPYLPMLDVFRAYYGIADRDDERTIREKIAGRLLLLDDDLRDVLPIAFEFFGVADPARPVPRMDPDAKRRQIFALLRRSIRDPDAAADRLVVVVEDLHWLDDASEELLASWVDALDGSSALLLVNFRPEYRAPWMERPWYRHLPLAPLEATATRELVGHLLGDDASVAGLAGRIHAQTSGNPFFIEEVVQALVDAGDLVGARGAYRLVVDAATVRVPPSVHGILAARIDRLPEREKRVLQTAAVIGQTFAEPTLVAVADRPDDEIRAALVALQAADLVFEQSPYPTPEYAFKHPLTREVALRSQLQERRRTLHAATARVLEAAHADKRDEHAALVAHHWEEAGDPAVAAQWQLRAARWVRGRDVQAAGRHLARAVELVRRAPDGPALPLLGATACRERLALGFRVGLTPEDADRIFADGLAFAARLDDPIFVGRLHQAQSVLCNFHLRPEDALGHAAEWERIASAADDPELRSYARWASLSPLRLSGDLAGARRNVEWQLAAAADQPAWGSREWGMSAQANARNELAYVELASGRIAEARMEAERAAEVARLVGDVENQWNALNVLALAGFFAGEPDAARPCVHRLVEIGERVGSDWLRTESACRLAGQRLAEGDPGGARDLLEPSTSAERASTMFTRFVGNLYLTESFRLLADLPAARRIAEENRASLRARGLRLWLVEAELALARVLRDADGVTAAERIDVLLDEAEAAIRATGAALFTPFVLVERAALAALRGAADEERRLLAAAAEGFTTIGAPARARAVMRA